MERKIIENGTTLRWHNSKDELPNLKNENDTWQVFGKEAWEIAKNR